LALSGGGFRASLFHIGMLARLAELDLLREVQVLSTVSGGSIIGALYYLHARKLLQSKRDADITGDDYIALVDELWREFTAALEHNLRMLTFADRHKNRRMLSDRRYSRSDRMAELYEEYLYARVAGVTPPERVRLPALTVTPYGEPNFHPFRVDDSGRTANDRRRNKVPVLVLNASTLNTGHNFQFTTTWLGEPPGPGGYGDLDRNLRLRRAYYTTDRLPDKYQTLPLGAAVAASATVPGLFPPLALTDLYRDGDQEITPQLVDGGVHDNQGIEGLLDPEHPCTHLIVSDASGQMDDVSNPLTSIGAVLKRSNDALMDRVREEQYAVARLLERTGDIRTMVFFHLRECLQQRELTWIGGRDKANQVYDVGMRTPYGVDPRVQDLLSSIRTDLDAFSEIEAHALMADGYLIARHHLGDAFRESLGGQWPPERQHGWDFLDAQPYLENPDLDPAFTAQLATGSRLFGKTLRIVPSAARTPMALVGGAALAVLLLAGGALWWFAGRAVFAALGVLALSAGARIAAKVWNKPRLESALRWFHSVFPGLITSPLLAAAVSRHLRTWTPLRLEFGRIDRLRQPDTPRPRAEREAA
jgi:predicted acylesterase/phospholipase RssA